MSLNDDISQKIRVTWFWKRVVVVVVVVIVVVVAGFSDGSSGTHLSRRVWVSVRLLIHRYIRQLVCPSVGTPHQNAVLGTVSPRQ